MEVIIMPLIDNTFENQSAIADENPGGGALGDALGGGGAGGLSGKLGEASSSLSNTSNKLGGTAGGLGSSLTSATSLALAKSSLLSQLNKLPAGALFLDGKFQFPVDLKNKYNLDKLLSAMTAVINNNLPISNLFKDGIQGIFSNFLTQLKSDASETWGFLKSASGTFLQTLADKYKGILLSRIYVPDAVFLAGLYPLAGVGSNITYKNHYVRNLCFKHDMPLSLAYVDSLEGIRYTVENNKGVSEAMKAARYGSFNVAFYIMRELQKEIRELEGCYPLPKNYNRATQEGMKKSYEVKINESKTIIDFLESTVKNETALNLLPQYKTAKKDYEDNTKMMEALAINNEDKYMKDPQYKTIQTLIDKGYKNLYKIMKTIIVNSYSNLTPKIVSDALNEFGLQPSAFGTKDKKYGQIARISKGDLNTMLPFFKPKKGKSLIGNVSSVTKQSSLIPDYEQTFIIPRNVNNKSIYILLASKNIQKEYMTNKEWYERLKYPVYSTLISALDKSFSGLLDVGIGKTLVGVIKTIEEAFYIYGKSMEPYLFNPASIEYISYNDMKSLPEPDPEEVKKQKSNTKSKNSSNGKNSSSKVNTSKAATGPTVDSEADPYTPIVESMNEVELHTEIKRFSEKNDLEIAAMTTDEKKKYLIRKYSETQTPTEEIVDRMSDDTLRRYLVKRGVVSESEVATYDRAKLREYTLKNIKRLELDFTTDVSKLMLADDMKRYIRKYGGAKESDFFKKSDEYIAGRFRKLLNEQGRKIYYSKECDTCGYDAQGFPILGYPSQEVILETIRTNNVGSYKHGYPNAFPVTDTGYICPIIGYNTKGKAVYGTPLFYTDIEPIGSDSRNRPVFAYYKDRSILEDNNLTEYEVNKNIEKKQNKIDTLQSYINNGASGVLKAAYQKEIISSQKIINDYNDMLKYMLIKPVIGYDEFGNRVFGETDLIYNIENPEGYKCIGYDFNGKPVYEYTEEERTVIGYNSNDENIYGSAIISPFGTDENGKLIYGFDLNNRPIYGFTVKGEPVIEIIYNDKGVESFKISNVEKRNYIGKTKKGRPIYEYDVMGNSIVGYDKNGNGYLEPMEEREIDVYYNEYNSRSTEIMDKVKAHTRKYVIANKYPTYFDEDGNPKFQNSESLVDVYIETDFKNGNLLKEIEANENRHEWISDAQISMLGNYKVQYDSYERKKEIFNRLKNEKPTPPIIGIDDENIPILGEALIIEEIEDKPELIYSSENAINYGYKQTVVNEENILDKEDFDIEKDFAKAEQELIKSLNGQGNIGRVVQLVYGINDTEELIVEVPETEG
jgi:hypothetical protein